MPLSDASLIELVAELRERLRRLLPGPAAAPSGASPRRPPGPLDPAGRASLAARLIGVVVGGGPEPEAAPIAAAFDDLAEALLAIPVPLPGSALESGLARLAHEFETLATSWDAAADVDGQQAWLSLRRFGDRLWLSPGTEPRPLAAGPPAPAAIPALTVGTGDAAAGRDRALWLLVAGSLRRDTLRRRLQSAGWLVECPRDAEATVARLERERPVAVVCDDAAPARHHSRLSRRLPAGEPPLILVRGRTAHPDAGAGAGIWLPPYRLVDLAASLPR